MILHWQPCPCHLPCTPEQRNPWKKMNECTEQWHWHLTQRCLKYLLLEAQNPEVWNPLSRKVFGVTKELVSKEYLLDFVSRFSAGFVWYHQVSIGHWSSHSPGVHDGNKSVN